MPTKCFREVIQLDHGALAVAQILHEIALLHDGDLSMAGSGLIKTLSFLYGYDIIHTDLCK